MELREKINKFIQDTANLNNFENGLVEGFNVISASKGKVEIEYEVNRNECNQRHILHGGAIAAFSDLVFNITWVTTLGINEEINHLPFTVNININYISGIKLGEKMIIKSKIEKETNNFAFLKLKMMHGKDKRLLNTASATLKTIPRTKL